MIDINEEWDKFNKNIHSEKQTRELHTPQHKTTQEITIEKTANTQEVEHIPITPTSKIVLRIEDIPPLDVFYILSHKFIVERQSKKSKLDATTATTLDNELMDIVWKDSPIDPSANLTRIS